MDAFAPAAAAFRFYENDGSPSESASTPVADQDTSVTRNVDSDNAIHLRYRVDEIGSGSINGATTDDYQLQWRKNGAGSWFDVTASSSNVQLRLPDSGDRAASSDREALARSSCNALRT